MLDILLGFIRDILFFCGRISTGDSFPQPLSAEDERIALVLAAEGNEAERQKLVEHNLRLVAHIAKKYTGKGADMDDLISIGTIGLIKAVATFDAEKGSSLATYASRCIENEMLMFFRSLKKRSLEVSIDDPIGADSDGNSISLGDILGSAPGAIHDEVELSIASSALCTAVETVLSERERLVIRLRYGLWGGEYMPQREVGRMLGISRSYVSRIEKRALEKLQKVLDK